jgi:dTDP-4-dehydrorhamnose reductase
MAEVVVIGKNGQLGSALVEVSKSIGISIAAFSKEELDITDLNKVNRSLKKEKPRIVINTSAYHVLRECEKYPLKALEVNCTSVSDLALICKELGIKFVTYSTNYVFDGKKRSPYTELDKFNPLQMYGLSKLAGEISSINNYPAGTYVIRTCGVYGKGKKGSRSKKGNFILKILKEADSGGSVRASKTEIVNPTYALDLADASLRLINSKAESGIYHLASEGYCSWYEFAEHILKAKGKKAKLIASENQISEYKIPPYSVLKNTKAKKIGVKLPYVFDSLEKYLSVI